MEHMRADPALTSTPDDLGATPMALSDVDLADPDLYEEGDPEPLWARLRTHAPVHHNTRKRRTDQFWTVTTHELVHWSEADGQLESRRSRRTAMGTRTRIIPTDQAAESQGALPASWPLNQARRVSVMSVTGLFAA